jgi:hypothetical protein
LAKYDNVRNFIFTKTPILRCICVKDEKSVVENRLWPLWEKNGDYVSSFRLFGLDFICDLSKDQREYQQIFKQFKNVLPENGWTHYPCDNIKE